MHTLTSDVFLQGVTARCAAATAPMAPAADKKKETKKDASEEWRKEREEQHRLEHELVVSQVRVLEEKLMRANDRCGEAEAQHADAVAALASQRADQADIVSYMRRELEKGAAEHAQLSADIVALREASECEQGRLQQEVLAERAATAVVREQLRAADEASARFKE